MDQEDQRARRAREPGGPESQEGQRARRAREPGGPEGQEGQRKRAREPGGPQEGQRARRTRRWNSNSLEKYPAAEPSPNKNERPKSQGWKVKASATIEDFTSVCSH